MAGIRIEERAGGEVDLELDSGGIAVGETRGQDMWLVLESRRGDWKEHPKTGVGIGDLAGDEESGYWQREIAAQLRGIGVKTKRVRVAGGGIEIVV